MIERICKACVTILIKLLVNITQGYTHDSTLFLIAWYAIYKWTRDWWR